MVCGDDDDDESSAINIFMSKKSGNSPVLRGSGQNREI